MTLEEAKSLKAGDMIHHVSKTNADGSPMRAKVTSIKTWKRKPNYIEVRVKRGMYEFATFHEYDLNEIEVGEGR